jgi:glycosyltransferase involved in cell wall biosynthesis
MILTQGDSFADLVEKEELGRTVPPGDVEGWKKAILEMARDSKFRRMARSRVQALAPEFRWDKVAEPLLNYCRQPYRPARTPRIHSKLVPLLSAAYQQFSRFVQ